MTDKLPLHSLDIVSENIERIAALFPNCITETDNGKAIDFDLLRQELNKDIVEGTKERYRLEWPGKREAIVTANLPTTKTLRPIKADSVDFDNTQNLYIEGDNLEVLKLLQESYLGKIKMIEIDPPYNTGNDFVYKDNFTQDSTEFKEESGLIDEYNQRLIANPDTSGRYHSNWLTMMYPRLKLARNLLTDDGVIFIHIDDNEVHNLRKLCDEIFGEGNFVDNIIWKKRYGGGAKEKYLVSLHEYILIFAKNVSLINPIFIPNSEEAIKRYYIKKDNKFEKRGPYRTHPLEATKSMGERKNLVFSIQGPDGSEIWPKRQWLWGKERVAEALSNDDFEFLKDKEGNWSVNTKQYLKDEDGKVRESKAFSIIDDVYSQHGTNEILDIFGNAQLFSFPKPTQLIKKLVNIGLENNGEVVLDLFSGSSSTAHAVMQLNAEDGGNRKFIMVQVPEATDEKSEAYKAGYKNICEIGKERIRRAAKKIKESKLENSSKPLVKASEKKKRITKNPLFASEEQEELLMVNEDIAEYNVSTNEILDLGFRVYRLDSSNMQDVYYKPQDYKQENLNLFANNIKPDRTPEDLLAQIMLSWGLPLHYKIERLTIQGKQVFKVAENSLYACFDNGIDEVFAKEIATHKPLRIVFNDASFKDDTAKENVKQLLKQLSPTTEMKVI